MTQEAGPLAVDVQNLRRVLNALLDLLESNGGRLIDIERDHYWLLELSAAFADDVHQPGTRPDDVGAGQISDDVGTVNEIASALERGDAVLNPWHDLEHAVGLLRALAWKDLPS